MVGAGPEAGFAKYRLRRSPQPVLVTGPENGSGFIRARTPGRESVALGVSVPLPARRGREQAVSGRAAVDRTQVMLGLLIMPLSLDVIAGSGLRVTKRQGALVSLSSVRVGRQLLPLGGQAGWVERVKIPA